MVARRGRPVAELVLTGDESATLQRWAELANAPALAQRCRIILGCAAGNTNKQVAADLGVSQEMVCKWRQRFIDGRLDGLADKPRPGAPRTITDEAVEDVIVATLERQPKDGRHWSRSTMAAETGLSRSAVGRIWKSFGIGPQRTDTFKISADPQFVAKVRDVVGLYLDPPEKALVLCVDEKAQIYTLDHSAAVMPMTFGIPWRTMEYAHHGATTLFAALDLATGEVCGSPDRRRRATEFKKFLVKVDSAVPAGLDIHVICDNYSTHKSPTIMKWLAAHPRFHMHFTPTYSSWLHQIEHWSGLLTHQNLRRSVYRSIQAFENDIRDWISTWNKSPHPFNWTKSADEILERLAPHRQRVPGAAH